MQSAIIEELRKIGLHVSPQWLDECYSAIAARGAVTANLILQQSLSHDLRDVVRQDENSPSNATGSPSQTLHASIQQNEFCTLPDDFRLVVQIEEVTDVSKNAEDRLKGTSTNNRCLKLALSDGFYAGGLAQRSPTGSDVGPIYALETSPISCLSSSTLAGTKICLHGKIPVRRGILLLDSDHVTLLGGSVAELVQIQQNLWKQAKDKAGVGVDPTIRALVREDTVQDVEEEEEGENESSDVVEQQQPPLGHSAASIPATSAAQPFPAPTNQFQPATRPNPPPAYSVSPAAISTRQFQSANRSNAVPAFGVSTATTTTSAVSRVSTANQSQSAARSNPTPGFGGSPNPVSNSFSHTSTVSGNPYATRTASSQPSRFAATSSTPIVMDTEPPSSASTATESASASQSRSPPLVHNNESCVETPFPQIYELLRRVCASRELYEKYAKKTFRCQLKQKGPKLDFSIAKNPLYKKGSAEKYEYTMFARFQGSSESDSLLTSKVSNHIMEPFFDRSPTAMRNLNKGQREKAAELVKEGGVALSGSLVRLAVYEFRLYHTAESFFSLNPAPRLDGQIPVIELLRKD